MVNLFFETLRSRELEAKVKGIDIVRLRSYVQFEKRTGEISIHDAIVDTGAFISLIPFSIWREVEVDRLVNHRVEGLIAKSECSIPVIIGKIGLRLVDEEEQTEKIDIHAYLALTDEIPLILGFKDFLSSFKVCFDYKENSAWLEHG
jgi:hypothetical protein